MQGCAIKRQNIPERCISSRQGDYYYREVTVTNAAALQSGNRVVEIR